jgi:hypothetical protein
MSVPAAHKHLFPGSQLTQSVTALIQVLITLEAKGILGSPASPGATTGDPRSRTCGCLSFHAPHGSSSIGSRQLPISRLELSRMAADAFACCGADGGGDLS